MFSINYFIGQLSSLSRFTFISFLKFISREVFLPLVGMDLDLLKNKNVWLISWVVEVEKVKLHEPVNGSGIVRVASQLVR